MGERQERTRSVITIPQLGKVPRTPRSSPDPRQAKFHRIKGSLQNQLGGRVAQSQLSGFPASSVNLGRLKHALESGIVAFTFEQVQKRWKDDVRAWMIEVTTLWVQRCKSVTIRLRGNGIDVSIVARDDLGDYRYQFDVWAGR